MQYLKKKNKIVSKFSHLLVIIAVLCAVVPAAVSAATYYVNPSTGSDDNPGTSASPWKTPAWANTHAANGSTVYLASGDYGDVIFNQKITRTDWSQAITFEAASGATPVFASLRFSSIGNAYIAVKGATINGVDAGASTYDAGVDILNSSCVKVINCKINGVWKSRIEDGMTNTGIRFRTSTTSIENVTLDGCEITNVDVGISVSGQIGNGIILCNNYIYHISGTGIQISPGNKDTSGLIVIENNHISGQHSVLEGTGSTHGSGISIRANNLLVRGNIIHGCGNTRGIRTYQSVFPDTGYQNLTFENNLVYDTINDLPVEFVDLGGNIIFRNNTIIGHYADSSLAKYKYGAAASFKVATQADGSTVSFHNNIFVGYISLNPGFINYTENNNIIWAALDWTSGGAPKRSLKGDKTLILCADNYAYDLNFFESSGGFFVGGGDFDTYSYTVTRLNGNNTPHRKNLNTVYKLASGSTAIGFGDTAKAPATDLAGAIRGSAVDAGCYEFAASSGLPVNQTPVFTPIGNKTAPASSLLAFTLAATDPDGDLITYSATNMPAGATLTGNSFSWTPTTAQQGTFTITFTASDGKISVSQQVAITVTGTNNPPVIGSVSSQSVVAGTLLSFAVPMSDPDGDSLLKAAMSMPSGATFQNGVFQWTPAASQTGNYTVTFYANDSLATTTKNVPITVTAAPATSAITVIIDNGTANTAFTGKWLASTAPNAYGGKSVYSWKGATYTWIFKPTVTGTYRVSMWWTALATRNSSVPVKIPYRGGTATVNVNQQLNGGMWNTLGQYTFTAGATYRMVMTASSPTSPPSTCADAMKFEKL